MPLDEDRLRAIMRDTVSETLTRVGFNVDEPIELQKDMAHLRYWRQSVEQVQRRSMLAAVGIVVTGAMGALWVGVRAAFAGHP